MSGAITRAVSLLTAEAGRPVRVRQLVNFLRGNQLPPSGVVPEEQSECFGLLAAHTASWIEEVIERLVECSCLNIESRSPASGQQPATAVSLTQDGTRALSGEMPWPTDVLPIPARIGTNPELENRLRALRRKLARAEGRTAFGIFPNSTLAELAARKPDSLGGLAEISGLGEARIRKYGRRILAVLRR